MADKPVLWSIDARGVATVTFNRPEVNNAYNGDLIQGVLQAMDELGLSARAYDKLNANAKHSSTTQDSRWNSSALPLPSRLGCANTLENHPPKPTKTVKRYPHSAKATWSFNNSAPSAQSSNTSGTHASKPCPPPT